MASRRPRRRAARQNPRPPPGAPRRPDGPSGKTLAGAPPPGSPSRAGRASAIAAGARSRFSGKVDSSRESHYAVSKASDQTRRFHHARRAPGASRSPGSLRVGSNFDPHAPTGRRPSARTVRGAGLEMTPLQCDAAAVFYRTKSFFMARKRRSTMRPWLTPPPKRYDPILNPLVPEFRSRCRNHTWGITQGHALSIPTTASSCGTRRTGSAAHAVTTSTPALCRSGCRPRRPGRRPRS